MTQPHSRMSGVAKMHVRVWTGILCATALFGFGMNNVDTPSILYPVTGDVDFSHDPTIIKAGKLWYVFTTGKAPDGGLIAVRTSPDLIHWKLAGHVFDEMPKWITAASPRTRDLWAPDISHEDGQYRLYYAYSLFGRNTSGIGLATNETLDPTDPKFKWLDQGLVLYSTTTDNYNAIDPNFIRDRHGREWLSFGSFWSGIKMRELDSATGKPLSSNREIYALAARAKHSPNVAPDAKLPPDSTAIEAPSIVHHGGYYYLFVSWDLCCRGAKSTYRTMVGRSKEVTGPYVDHDGTRMDEGGGLQILGPNSRWAGAGGESALVERGSPDLIVFHAYDKITGKPSLEVATISWQDDWPVIADS
jgi:arabinan endo-1,5-alpha-L-arabinosidase